MPAGFLKHFGVMLNEMMGACCTLISYNMVAGERQEQTYTISMPPLWTQPVSWLVAALTLLSACIPASAQQDDSNLCSCIDLLWKPEPSHAWEVVNWHSKLVAELNAAESKGVCNFNAFTCICQMWYAASM